MTLSASTGQADGNSVWGSGLLNFVTGAADAASQVIGALDPQRTTAAATPNTEARSNSTGMPGWLLPVAVVVAGAVAIWFLVKKL